MDGVKTKADAMVGLRFGLLTVIGVGATRNRSAHVMCVCDCGKLTSVATSTLSRAKRGQRSCGCSRSRVIRDAASAKARELVDNGDGTHSVPLANGGVALIDSSDAALVAGKSWSAAKRRNRLYALSRGTYMHRLLCGDGQCVDHVNGNGLDNRRANLRPASVSQNGFNRGRQANNRSGFKGVSFRKDVGKWDARIKAYGKQTYLGLFDTAEDAAAAYAVASLLQHGEFSVNNESGGGE